MINLKYITMMIIIVGMIFKLQEYVLVSAYKDGINPTSKYVGTVNWKIAVGCLC